METIFETIAKNNADSANIDIAVKETVEKIAQENPRVNAVIWQDEDFISKEIARVKQISNTAPLYGLPILVKELEASIKGTPNSWANKVLKEQEYKDTFTSTSVKLLQEAGAIIVGKTNNCELGINVTTNSSAHGSCCNPHDLKQNSGGSSGGSAAAVASGMVRVASGNDGGGSIRIPSAVCGTWGYKSTRGRISNGPIISGAWAGLSAKGLIGASVKEMALVGDLITKAQSGDQYSAHPLQTNFVEEISKDLPKLKIGIRTTPFGNAYEVTKPFIDATNTLADFLSMQGHEVSIASPQIFNQAWILETFDKIIAANVKADFEEMMKRSKGKLRLKDCDPTAQYFIEESKKVSASDYINACYDMEYFTNATAPFFDEYDVLITPTISDFAPLNDVIKYDGSITYNPYTYAGFTAPINFIGGCAFAVPVKSDETALPLSVQIASKRDNDHLIFQISHYLECNYPKIYSISTK